MTITFIYMHNSILLSQKHLAVFISLYHLRISCYRQDTITNHTYLEPEVHKGQTIQALIAGKWHNGDLTPNSLP